MSDLVLCRRLNHRNIELHDGTTGETVGVLKRDGSYTYVPWLGFIERSKAKSCGKPVKLLIARVGRKDSWNTIWEDIAEGRHVQGCITSNGAFAVIDHGVKIV